MWTNILVMVQAIRILINAINNRVGRVLLSPWSTNKTICNRIPLVMMKNQYLITMATPGIECILCLLYCPNYLNKLLFSRRKHWIKYIPKSQKKCDMSWCPWKNYSQFVWWRDLHRVIVVLAIWVCLVQEESQQTNYFPKSRISDWYRDCC